jgi:predicted RNA-binding protein with PIN domain
VIDGNNLIGHEKGLALGADDSRATLVRALCALARRTRKGITVVFDGPAPAGGPDASVLGGVKVLYAGAGRSAMSADDRILRMVEGSSRPADLRVVTSDSALGNRARRLGAAVVPCHKFRPLLRDAAAAEASGPEKPSHVDVRDWASWFGIDPGD